jgi:hypothetical protein
MADGSNADADNGQVTATEALGVAFDSPGLKIFGCVLAACLVLVWLAVFTQMLRCLWRREL